jgi:hypothetical protein
MTAVLWFNIVVICVPNFISSTCQLYHVLLYPPLVLRFWFNVNNMYLINCMSYNNSTYIGIRKQVTQVLVYRQLSMPRSFSGQLFISVEAFLPLQVPNKTDHQDITVILVKVVLNTIPPPPSPPLISSHDIVGKLLMTTISTNNLIWKMHRFVFVYSYFFWETFNISELSTNMIAE